jgi:hypothetical protein
MLATAAHRPARRGKKISGARIMTHRNVVRFLSSALLAAVVFGCSDNSPSVGPSSGLLQVTPLYTGIDQGNTENLSASLNGAAVPVTWVSSDVAIATVSANGVVTGVAPGKAAVTATMVGDPTQTRSASISVAAVYGTAISSGVPVTNVSSGTKARSDGLLYRIFVPAGATALTVTFTGGTGDGDIYVQKGTPPDDSVVPPGGCASGAGGNKEACTVTNPGKGTWYIFVAVWDPYAGATLTATVTP